LDVDILEELEQDRTGRTGTRPVDVGCDVIVDAECSPKTPPIPLDDIALL